MRCGNLDGMTDHGGIGPRPDLVGTFAELLDEVERLRISAARGREKPRLSLQDIASASGIPKSSLANYLSGATLIPADKLDAVVQAMGVTPAESVAWASAWDRAMNHHLRRNPVPEPAAPEPVALAVERSRWARLDRRLVAALVVVVALVAGGVLFRVFSRPANPTQSAMRPLCRPVTGDWDGRPSTTPGLVCRAENGMSWNLINGNEAGLSPKDSTYGNYDYCLPVTGDWNADGATTIGVACGGGSQHAIRWSLINGFSGSPSFDRFVFGDSDTCRPVTGDWDGDGTTTVGAACRTDESMRWRLSNVLAGRLDAELVVGDFDDCLPVTGDWDGNRTTTPGVICRDGVRFRWSLTNVLTSGESSYPSFESGADTRGAAEGWPGPPWPTEKQ
jgi:transcriptional regulator with XRE-family HTH domain